jgi:quercetin dioxygenase-like cupin family protein
MTAALRQLNRVNWALYGPVFGSRIANGENGLPWCWAPMNLPLALSCPPFVKSLLPAALLLLAAAAPAPAQLQPTVVPPHEHLPMGQEATVTQGVLAVKRLGGQPLEADFSALRGRELRLREITVAPGGSIGLHRHHQRPGVAYMLEGEMTERRAPAFTPRVIGPGDVAFEGSDVTHWWRNEGTTPARALVVDIVPVGSP